MLFLYKHLFPPTVSELICLVDTQWQDHYRDPFTTKHQLKSNRRTRPQSTLIQHDWIL